MHIPRRHLNYANVVATLALVFAMSGGALAAKHYLINSTKQINPKVLKKLKGNAGKTGATGPAGAPGKEGPQGKEGKTGSQGEPGPFLATLPSGKTLKGHYHIETDGSSLPADTGAGYSYAFPLASTPVGHFIADGTTPPSQCPGTVSNPEAAPGNLCVYEGPNHTNDTVQIGSNSDQFGFGLLVSQTASASYWSIGAWAVTAP